MSELKKTDLYSTQRLDAKTLADSAKQRSDQNAILSIFDGLVRSVKSKSTQVTQIAQRLIDTWCLYPAYKIHIDAESIYHTSQLKLRAKEEGDWIFPAFMAGVRSIQSAGATVNDAIRLCSEIADLEYSEESLNMFRDWLWSDGAEGWLVSTNLSFVEIFEVNQSLEGSSQKFGALRASVMLHTDDTELMQINTQELDRAALLPEFQLSVDMFAQGVENRAFELVDHELRQLSQSAQDTLGWSYLELQAILFHASLRQSFPEERLARRLIDAVETTPDVSMVKALQEIDAMEGTYIVNLKRTLYLHGIQLAVAKIPLESQDLIQEVTHWAKSLPPQPFMAWLGQVMGDARRAQNDAVAISVCQALGLSWLLSEAQWSMLKKEEVAYMGDILLKQGCSDDDFAKFIEHLAPEATGVLLSGLNTNVLMKHVSHLEHLIYTCKPSLLWGLIPPLIQAHPWCVNVLFKPLISSKEAWPHHIMKLMAPLLHQTPEGTDILALLVRRVSWEPRVRYVILDQLLKKPEHEVTQLAIKWKVKEIFDTPEFCARLKQERRRFKQTKSVDQ